MSLAARTSPVWLVTGGAGFIGSALVRQLIAETETRVVNVDALTYAGHLGSLRSVMDHPHHVFVHGDVTNAPMLREVLDAHQPDIMLHLAAESHVDRSIDASAIFIQTNVVGTYTVLEEARRYYHQLPAERAQAFRLLHVSTDEVFGSATSGTAFNEDSPYDPSSPYAASKAAADHLVRAWHRTYGLPAIITNCSNNYGPCQFPEKLIPLMIQKAMAGETLPLFGDGLQIRDWLHVDDHARALRLVAERGVPGQTYVVGANSHRDAADVDTPTPKGEFTNLEVVRMICAILDEVAPGADGPRERLIRFVDDRPGHDYRYAIDSSRIRQELGWKPTVDFETGLRNTIAWYRDNTTWVDAATSGAYRGERLGLLSRIT